MSDYNPYTAPQALLDDEYDEYEEFEYDHTPFFKPTGRIGRIRFLAYNGIWLGLIVVYLIALAIIVEKLNLPLVVIYIFGGIFALYAVITPMIRRLTDLGRSGWWAILYFVPYLNFVFFLCLLFIKGDDDVNDYGAPPTPPTLMDYLSIGLIPLILGGSMVFFGGLKAMIKTLVMSAF